MSRGFKGASYMFHDNCEKKAYVNFINHNLFGDLSICSQLPINPDSDDLFDSTCDGTIYCSLIQVLFPNSLDTSLIETAQDNSDITHENKMKNIYLAYETALSMGCNVKYLRVYDIFCGVRQSVLEFLWQLFNVGLVNSISFKNNSELINLMEHNESIEALRLMKPIDTLIRYVNYRIAKYFRKGPFLNQINDELNNGKIYAHLIYALSYDDNKKQPPYLINTIINEKNDAIRAEMLIDNLTFINVEDFIIDEMFRSQCTQRSSLKVHLLLIAVIFHTHNLPTDSIDDDECCVKPNIFDDESVLEKLCRGFLNFFGVKPICTDIVLDNKTSLLLIQLLERFDPDLFQNDKIYHEFNGDQATSLMIYNASKMLHRFQRFYSMQINDLYPESIVAGNSKVICGIIYNLILYWAMNDVGDSDRIDGDSSKKLFDKSALLSWVNSISDVKINSFRDLHIIKDDLVLKFIDKLYPNNVNWETYNSLDTLLAKAAYTLSVGRKQGCPLIMTPDMLSIGDHHAIMLIFTLLKYRSSTNSTLTTEHNCV